MADIMEVDDCSVKKTHKSDMSSPADDKNEDPWCLTCSYMAGQPEQEPCGCAPDEATRLFTSELEDDKRQTCRRIYALKGQMEELSDRHNQQMLPNPPEVARHIKYQQQLLHIKLFATLLYTNQLGGLDDKGKRELDVRKYIGADGKALLAIGIDSLGLWINFETEPDDKPDYQKLVPHEDVTETTSGHGRKP